MEDRKAIIVGISGCSSSGKTTLARLLRDIFPHTFILHEDDFYKPEDQLPIKHGLVDWDCPEAISVPDMEFALHHIRSTGTFPPTVDSKEDQNSVGTVPISPAKLTALKERVLSWLSPSSPGKGHLIFPPPSSSLPPPPPSTPSNSPSLRLCLVDGFLLYSPPSFTPIMSTLDIKLFLLVSRAKATQRRENRDGYVTLEGFWTDPPGYVDKIVWPNYAESHAWMFKDGDAEAGVLDEEVLAREGILAQLGKGLDVDFEETVEWVVDTVMGELERIVLGGEEE
ncbi:P-loop containing nucleoside triphosphate hydrolase protein [Cercophora newfieldiana]|uniref:P-loop containing nucleoside triphosphate hydrolase protein n=1 Tax=Cercophora newfieldiana TaxID=92897 RepID=A0AA39YFB2_9PEZI|nr:P-loop containing nucleoside triphosphate hydrolase protein [Cercophora newfieldiana]